MLNRKETGINGALLKTRKAIQHFLRVGLSVFIWYLRGCFSCRYFPTSIPTKGRIPLRQDWSLIIVIFFDRKLTTTHREVEWAWSRRRVTSPRRTSLSRGLWRLTPANTRAALPTPTPRQSSCTCWTVRPKWLFVVEGMGLLRRIRGRRWWLTLSSTRYCGWTSLGVGCG